MELMEEIDRCIKRIEAEKKTYVPKQSVLEKIQSNPVSMLDRCLFRNYVYYTKYKKDYSLMDSFDQLTHIPIKKIGKMSDEVKREIRNCILKRLESIPIEPREFVLSYNNDVYPIESRIRFVVKGKNVEGIYWITKEKQEEIHKKLIDFTMLGFDKLLQLKKNIELEKAILALDIALLNKKIPHTDNFILESEIKNMVETENEREQLKLKINDWYKDTKQTFIVEFIENQKENTNCQMIKEWLYLMTPQQKQQVQEFCVSKIKQDFNEMKKETKLTELEEMKNLLQSVLNWTV